MGEAVAVDLEHELLSETVSRCSVAESQLRGWRIYRYCIEGGVLAFLNILFLGWWIGPLDQADRGIRVGLSLFISAASLVLSSLFIASVLKELKLRSLNLSEKLFGVEFLLILSALLIAGVGVWGFYSPSSDVSVIQTLSLNLLLLPLLALSRHQVLATLKRFGASLGFDIARDGLDVEVLDGGSGKTVTGDLQDAKRWKKIPLAQVRTGSLVKLVDGGVCPFDCEVISGIALVKEAKYFPGSTKFVKSAGLEILAGSKIVQGQVIVKVTGKAADASISIFSSILNKQTKAALDKKNGYSSSDLPIENILGFIVFSIATAAGIYKYKAGLPIVDSMQTSLGVMLSAVVLSSLAFDQLLKPLVYTISYLKGFVFSQPQQLEHLANAKSVLLYIDKDELPSIAKVRDFEVLDSRLDARGLMSTVLAMASRVNTLELSAIAEYVNSNQQKVQLFPLEDFHYYPGLGVSAGIKGVEFSLGSEEFLLKRGVLIQSGEAKPANKQNDLRQQRYYYLALHDEVVARFALEYSFKALGVEWARSLKELGYSVRLEGAVAREALDELGRDLGLELAEIEGNISLPEFTKRLKDRKQTCIAYKESGVLKSLGVQTKHFLMSCFDELQCKLEDAHGYILASGLEGLPGILRTFQLWSMRVRVHHYLLYSGLVTLLIAALVLNTPAILVAIAAFALIIVDSFWLVSTRRN